jgi:TetR/AcrR family transcriptional regulator, transcriptional repressor for nem operon
MARPRSYDRNEAVIAAKEVFWQHGYWCTAITDLEQATGLSRSSLYIAFQTKRGLFDAVLDEYETSFVDTMLGRMERDGAGLTEAAEFFQALAAHFCHETSRRGCLLVNSITELAGRDPNLALRGAQFADRFRSAFSGALTTAAAHGQVDHGEVNRRSELLSAAALGAWVAVRSDPNRAEQTCLAIASEIESWIASCSTARQ